METVILPIRRVAAFILGLEVFFSLYMFEVGYTGGRRTADAALSEKANDHRDQCFHDSHFSIYGRKTLCTATRRSESVHNTLHPLQSHCTEHTGFITC